MSFSSCLRVLTAYFLLICTLSVSGISQENNSAQDSHLESCKKKTAALYLSLAEWCRSENLLPTALELYRDALTLDNSLKGTEKFLNNTDNEFIYPDNFRNIWKEYEIKRKKLMKDSTAIFTETAKLLKTQEDEVAAAELLHFALSIDNADTELRKLLNHTWIKDFGWMSNEQAKRLRKGERLIEGTWRNRKEMKAENTSHQSWDAPWEIKDGALTLITDLPYDEGLKLLKEVQRLHHAHRELLSCPQYQVPDLIDPDTASLTLRVFEKEQDYRNTAKKLHNLSPPLTGYYAQKDRSVNINRIKDSKIKGRIIEVLYHEGTHQLVKAIFNRPVAENTNRPHYWAIEGFACYFETLKLEARRTASGNRNHWRLNLCRDLIKKKKYVSLKKFIQLTAKDLVSQHDPEQGNRNYAQSAGLVHFFLHYHGGRYKEQFLHYLHIAEDGRAETDSFETIFNTTPEEIETLWIKHIVQN